MKKILNFLIILIILSIFSCQRKTDIGYNILPKEDLLNTNITDTVSVTVHSIKRDSVVTSNVSELLLGEYQDPIFGYTKSSFALQLSNSIQYINFKDTDIVDSVILSLPYNQNTGNIYGNASVEQTVRVYQILNVDLDNNKQYYNTEDTSSYIGTLVGIKTYIPNPEDTTFDIKLNNSFGNYFIQADESNYSSGENFHLFFKGLYISAQSNNNNGAIVKYNINDDFLLTIYFHKNDGTLDQYTYQITANNLSNVRFNMISHDYSSANFAGQLNDESLPQDSVAYIQSGGGFYSIIKFPFLEHLQDSGKIIINRAELIVKTAPSDLTYESDFPAINKLFISGHLSGDSSLLIPEYVIQNSYAGELYNENTYKFDIATYVQNILNGNTENNGLNLVPAYEGNNVTRNVITTGNNSDPLKLVITYTKL